MSAKKRMGGLTGLSSFSGQRSEAFTEAPPAPKKRQTRKRRETQATLNIKVTRSQQKWLQDTAQEVRDNNNEAVPPDQRVYPQHLIGIAIDLLKAQGIDWGEIRNADELRDRLNL